jgi:hypothetical protein
MYAILFVQRRTLTRSMLIAGKNMRETEEQWQAQKQAAIDAINARSTAIQQGTQALHRHNIKPCFIDCL